MKKRKALHRQVLKKPGAHERAMFVLWAWEDEVTARGRLVFQLSAILWLRKRKVIASTGVRPTYRRHIDPDETPHPARCLLYAKFALSNSGEARLFTLFHSR